MGRQLVYAAIDPARLDELWVDDDEEFRSAAIEIEEDESLQRLSIGKIWDALHCTLTGKPASEPIAGDRLSESVVGVHPRIYQDDDYSIYVAVIENGDLKPLVDKLSELDRKQLIEKVDRKNMEHHKIYPNKIWEDPVEDLADEMYRTVQDIIGFFEKTVHTGNHIMVSIF